MNGKLALTIDIEDWYHIPSVCGSDFSVYPDVTRFMNEWSSRYDYLTKPTIEVLKILDESDVKATFFIVSDVIDNYPGLVETIFDKGHEVASHGLDHSCNIDMRSKLPRFSIDEFTDRNSSAKIKIEKAIGSKILGYRAPNALFAEWMIEPLSKLGFKYDSSLGRNSFIKKNNVTFDFSSFPVNLGRDEPFYEVPFSFWNLFNVDIPTAGGPYLRFLGSQIILKGLKQSLSRGDAIFYFHPIDISSENFPVVGKGRPFYWLIKGKLVKNRLINIIKYFKNRDVCFSTVQELMEL